MSGIKRSGVEAARKNLPALLEQAHHGEPCLITKHGKIYATIAPPSYLGKHPGGPDLRALRGSGKGLWGRSVKRAIARMRDEWR